MTSPQVGRANPVDKLGSSGAAWYYDTGNNDEMWLECDLQTLAPRAGINFGLMLGMNPATFQDKQRSLAVIQETPTSLGLGFWWASGEGHAYFNQNTFVNVTVLPQTIRCTLQRNTPVAGTSRLTVTPLDEPGNANTFDYGWVDAQTGSCCGVNFYYRYAAAAYGPIRIGPGLSP